MRWDKEAKSWYAPEGTNLTTLSAWLPDSQEFASLPDGAGHAFGAKIDAKGNLVIAAEDKDGTVWSAQRIGPTGFKGYEKEAKVTGCYQILGGRGALADQDAKEPVLVSTGFETSAAIHMATGRPVGVVFQDKNLQEVVLEFKQQFPQRSIAILGDDDRHLPERTFGQFVGNAVVVLHLLVFHLDERQQH